MAKLLTVLSVLRGPLVLMYPGLVYWKALGSFSSIYVGLLAACMLPVAYHWLGVYAPKRKKRGIYPSIFIFMLAIVLTLVWSPNIFFFALPVIISSGFFFVFFSSLWRAQTLVEKIARSQVQVLQPGEIRHCRSVTKVWCLFFSINGLVAIYLAIWASLGAWALYTGCLTYLAMGILFAAEYVIRKYRFQRYDTSFVDRFLLRVLPSSSQTDGKDPC